MAISLGELGEQLVGKWLSEQNYRVLHYRWRCRWGEIDLIARHRSQPTLVFVEVKTRSDNSWDSQGIEAISPGKQKKISQTAALFLSKNPQLADFCCRFDVALVHCQKHHSDLGNYPQGNSLRLENYLENAFDFYY
ncbi:TIGR00252 family protein [Xenococcus sp. PCC 7305]|uniref:YraN family protein n=1 Tax=Xenococcus sp. PCC 7305 TaxID=102125 RepID=UPI0002AC5CC3|nr:YraN family protein [Xenococcus sp. PCC 7305]ELS03548.1 TIGR00252 family protein [Xenococcus sp. PCC 7305]